MKRTTLEKLQQRYTISKSQLDAYKEVAIPTKEVTLKGWLQGVFKILVPMFVLALAMYTLVPNLYIKVFAEILLAIASYFLILIGHELLHAVVAVFYSYKVRFEGTTARAFVVVTHEPDEKWSRDCRYILGAPYVVLVPTGAVLLTMGLIGVFDFFSTGTNNMSLMFLLTGLMIVVFHWKNWKREKEAIMCAQE